MNLLDLTKATLVCGGGSFLVYTFPLFGQILLIGVFGLLWLLYARQTLANLWRR